MNVFLALSPIPGATAGAAGFLVYTSTGLYRRRASARLAARLGAAAKARRRCRPNYGPVENRWFVDGDETVFTTTPPVSVVPLPRIEAPVPARSELTLTGVW